MEVGVFALVAGEVQCAVHDVLQPVVGRIVAGGDADLLADDAAHADVEVLLFDVLVDVVVGETGQRAVRRDDDDLRLVGLAHLQRAVCQLLEFLLAEHCYTSSFRSRFALSISIFCVTSSLKPRAAKSLSQRSGLITG